MEGQAPLFKALPARLNEDDIGEAFSPANSVASTGSSSMSLTSDGSPVPSPASSTDIASVTSSSSLIPSLSDCDQPEEEARITRHCKNDYNRRIHPYENSKRKTVKLNNSDKWIFPKATHKSDYDEHLQKLFQSAVITANYSELNDLLGRHSESIDINKYDSNGHTPIQHLCQTGNLDLVKLLVQYGADLKLRTRDGWSIVHIASFAGSSELLTYVLKSCRR